ncbi:MAG: HAMP domain-containing histidine kinase [Acidobacteriia bacterium]|nr:HAMP domain-containing histidine kinase [Terriglobia bacterium]
MADPDMEALRRRIAELEAELERHRKAGQFLETSEANLQWFVRSLAHDFNNLLSAIMGHASLLEAISRHGEEVHESAAVIRKAAERATELTTQLLNFTRDGLGSNVGVDVHETIHEVADLLKRTVDPDIQLHLDLQAASSIVRGDPGQIHQMLLNLALNARDSMPGGGRMTLESTSNDDTSLVVTVRDTGCGIANDVCGRIFEPFFTTKKNGRNSGMGLAIVRRVVQNHGGSVGVDTVPGQGSAFRIRLPLSPK